jgi:quinoprotein glucose dehydrogenase
VALVFTHALSSGLLAQTSQIGKSWPAYGGDPGGARYSPLTGIDRTNVSGLRVAWTYRTGELGQDARDGRELTFEATPVLFEGTLYLSTSFGKVIALDPLRGTERWTYDAQVPRNRSYSEVTSRGVSTWRDERASTDAPCARRIFLGTIDARLIALDARTGAPCADFGRQGQVDLAAAVGMTGSGDYQVTSAPAVINDLIVVGTSIGDNWNVDTGPGVVRAFDARTGALRWAWDPIPRDSAGFRAGAANTWSTISADPARDLVFVPTSSPSPDFFGGLRPGDNRWANSIVALRASTGQLVWAFQTVHHDLWDYDQAAQPALVDIVRNGQRVPVVVLATKMGSLFVFHRETGAPVFPIEERPVLQTDVHGEVSHATQPFPTRPRPLMPQQALTPADAFGLNETDRAECRALLERYRSQGIYTPPSLQGTIMYPGNASGTNWGSVAFDPARNLVVLNTSRLATLVQLFPQQDFERLRSTEGGYEYARMRGAPFGMRRKTLLSSRGLPCNPLPWGTLAAVDLTSGDVKWEVPLGGPPAELNLPAEVAARMQGWPNGGGPIITAGGLIFIGATRDRHIRAFDIDTGREVWKHELPRAGVATPMTYEQDGRQFVVIAAGGHGKADLALGDYVIAFSLPSNQP